MRCLLLCGLVCVLMFVLTRCDEIETDAEVDDVDDVFPAGEKLPEKRGLPRRVSSKGCTYGFWCSQQ